MGRAELQGQRFERLFVEDFAYIKDGRTFWNCLCDCGNRCVIKGKYLSNGDTKSCGCLNIDRIRQMGKDNIKRNKLISMLKKIYKRGGISYEFMDWGFSRHSGNYPTTN